MISELLKDGRLNRDDLVQRLRDAGVADPDEAIKQAIRGGQVMSYREHEGDKLVRYYELPRRI